MKESIRKILREETVPIQIRRRLGLINQLIDVAINNKYVCDYEDENHFIKGVFFESFDLFRDNEFGLNELDFMDVYRFLETYRTDDIKEYFNERKEGCIDDLNESKDKKLLPPKKNYLKIIESLIEPFKDEVGVCDITVLYNKYVDMYSIYFILGVNEMDTMFSHYNPSGREKYARELRNKVKNDIKGYLTIPNIYVGSYTSYECGNNSDLNESENKKYGLLRPIEENGLFQVMQDTGLSFQQIISKTGELSREVLERYIRDFINEEGYHQTNGDAVFYLSVVLSKDKIAESFYLSGDKVTVEVNEYGKYSVQIGGFVESLSNFTDEEIYMVVKGMINW